MAGIYIHIPFCKTRCIYCDFYSTTRSELKDRYIHALCKELQIRKEYLREEPVETIYFGGGTPSQLAEEDFRETLDVVCKVQYDSAFTFIYSKRTGTPAAAMEDQISDDVVKDRFGRLLEEVQTISSKMCSRHEGTVQRVLVESCNEHDERLMTGRLSNNLLVHFPGDESMIGTFADVSLDECKGFYYIGKIVGK